MEYTIEKKRIEYFDLMKGVCIVLVVISHCYEEIGIRMECESLWSMLEHLRMPLYFFLSGMFFKEYSCFIDFVIRKINKLIIPFLFFSLITVIPKLMSGEIPVELIPIKKHFTWMIKFGGYLWFLRALFFSNILYYIFHKSTKQLNIYKQTCVILFFTAIGWWINSYIPLDGNYRETHTYLTNIVTSFLVLPFFFVATNLRKHLLNIQSINKLTLSCIFICSMLICYITSRGGVYLVNAKIENNIILFYIAAFSAITCVWCICFTIKRLFYFSYLGRYSIIVYLTHIPIMQFIVYKHLTASFAWLTFIVLLLMPIMIWGFNKYFPQFVAQRDLLTFNNGKISIAK